MEDTGERPLPKSRNVKTFTPNVGAATKRTIAANPPVLSSNETTSRKPPNVGFRGRGRGGHNDFSSRGRDSNRPGNGLLSSSGLIASGPFAQGPANMNRAIRDTSMLSGLNYGGGGGGGNGNDGRKGNRQTISFKKDPNNPADPDQDDYERYCDLEELTTIYRNPNDHLPVTLGEKVIKPDIIVNTNGNKDDTTRMINDDTIVNHEQMFNTGNLVLFQLPIPLIKETIPKSSKEKGTSLITEATSSKENDSLQTKESAMDIEAYKSIQEKEKENVQESSSLPRDGFYGKLRIHQSGKVTMLVDKNNIDGNDKEKCCLFEALPSSFKPEITTGTRRLFAIDPEYGQSFDLGQISSQFIFIPSYLTETDNK